ncbi:MAG: hypothetical protein ACKV2U_21435 [Bryobacteraceae bacterium]
MVKLTAPAAQIHPMAGGAFRENRVTEALDIELEQMPALIAPEMIDTEDA